MTKGNGGCGPRCVALVGPYGSGKTTLLESLLWTAGAITRKGSVAQGNTVGDASPEARKRQMSVEINCATTEFMGESFSFLDCPGSIEFLQETLNALPHVDAAIVVCEPDAGKATMLQPFLKYLSDLDIPHALFVNKIDTARGSLRENLALLQDVSSKPLVLRQIPIWENGSAAGFIDLALERAYVYRDHAASERIEMKDEVKAREAEARFSMLEKLADYDEHLMEELLSDLAPPQDEVFGDLSRDLAERLIVPVFIGSAEGDNGVRRLWKALRHETPQISATAARAGIKDAGKDGAATLAVLKTYHTAHGGKLSLARVLAGRVKDGAMLYHTDGRDTRIGGMFSLKGDAQTKRSDAGPGDIVALGRLEGVATGDMLSSGKSVRLPRKSSLILPPVYAVAVEAADRKDEVKLTSAIGRLCEEDPSLALVHHAELHEMLIVGQGEIHLKVAVEKLASKFSLVVHTRRPQVPYRETIRKPTMQRGRHKRQTGGHGQFGDVMLEIRPQQRGLGIAFNEHVVGGAVPRNFIPSVEKGVADYLQKGPLGFPVVDVVVTLTDGSYHSVDSSDAAFQMAARIAMNEGMPNCAPVLLEPVMRVRVHVPSDATSKVNGVISTRRGQILGFDAREGWKSWDTVEAELPQAELHDLIVELRSLTQGVGTYEQNFDHLAELTGRLADHVVTSRQAA